MGKNNEIEWNPILTDENSIPDPAPFIRIAHRSIKQEEEDTGTNRPRPLTGPEQIPGPPLSCSRPCPRTRASGSPSYAPSRS